MTNNDKKNYKQLFQLTKFISRGVGYYYLFIPSVFIYTLQNTDDENNFNLFDDTRLQVRFPDESEEEIEEDWQSPAPLVTFA